jgi:hypothetical protein
MARFAKPSDVEKFAVTLKEQYLQCRTYGHGFKPRTVSRHTAEGQPARSMAIYFEQTLRCACGVQRKLLLSRTGSIIASTHDYTDAPGYLAKDMGRIVGEGRDVLRLESVDRLLSKSVQQAKKQATQQATQPQGEQKNG